ncbi:LOW QUALITY PROTEIN: hypothetical protein PanWU01x14_219650 [Parasponia andersonii]|uniref:Uncharacterized protein n=1 Tax=Parasponia andersonii TaxID=3476 RepID=A0A2P5BQF5_PARAD|nr:LOW QUALITY PROTEIN: hypothetical protein PanWU01x14_219650 [Parasponia andersonii]
MAKRVYSDLHSKGYKPNIKIYQTMIHYLCKEGDYLIPCAKTACKRIGFRMCILYIPCLNLKKNGQLGKAKAIITMAQRRKPHPKSA